MEIADGRDADEIFSHQAIMVSGVVRRATPSVANGVGGGVRMITFALVSKNRSSGLQRRRLPALRLQGTLTESASRPCGGRAGAPHRGPEPVQFQPANRVRAGRQQR